MSFFFLVFVTPHPFPVRVGGGKRGMRLDLTVTVVLIRKRKKDRFVATISNITSILKCEHYSASASYPSKVFVMGYLEKTRARKTGSSS